MECSSTSGHTTSFSLKFSSHEYAQSSPFQWVVIGKAIFVVGKSCSEGQTNELPLLIGPGDVQITPVYTANNTKSPMMGYSIQTFNASLAEIYQVAADLIFGGTFADFLSGGHFVDITPDSDKTGCAATWSSTGGRPCGATYYLPAGIEPSVSAFLNSSDLASSNIVLAEDQRGSILRFEDGDPQWNFNATSECSAYGFDRIGISMCFKNGEPNEILARKYPQLESLELVDD